MSNTSLSFPKIIRATTVKPLRKGHHPRNRFQRAFPEQIAGRLQLEDQPVRVSFETIYAYVYGPDGQSKKLALFPAKTLIRKQYVI